MKNKIGWMIWILTWIVFSTSISWANGYNNDFKIRVGIFYGSKAKSSYTVSGTQLYVSAGGRVIWATPSSQMTVRKAGTVYYSDQSFSSYEEAASNSNEVYYLDGFFYAASEHYVSGYRSDSDANILIHTNDGKKLLLRGTIDQYIESADGIVNIEGTKYREKAHILHDGGKLIAINIVGLDNYLKGVVPKEMSASWNMEALKAQSVVARNYTLTNINKHVSEGFHMCNTTNCQVYGGMSAETARSNLAVEQTSGELMYYGGGVAQGYFHSSSGGQTESSMNIWGGGWIPYLKGVNDVFSLGSPHDVWIVKMTSFEIKQRLANFGVNIGDIKGVSITQISENGRVMELVIHGTGGTHILKKERIRTVLGSSKFKSTFFTLNEPTKVAGASISRNENKKTISDASLNEVFKNLDQVIEKHTNKPVQNVQTQPPQQNETVQTPIQVPSVGATLPNNPSIPQNITVYGDQFVFAGRGYGHGVGMSQYGAKGMADQGYNYHQILQYYFQGVTIAK